MLTFEVPTNLPDGVRITDEWNWGGPNIENWAGSSDGVRVKSGAVAIGSTRAACGVQKLILYVTPTAFNDVQWDPPPGEWQSQVAFEALGEDLELLKGPQTRRFNSGRMLAASQDFYLLTGSDCMTSALPEGVNLPFITTSAEEGEPPKGD